MYGLNFVLCLFRIEKLLFCGHTPGADNNNDADTVHLSAEVAYAVPLSTPMRAEVVLNHSSSNTNNANDAHATEATTVQHIHNNNNKIDDFKIINFDFNFV